MNKRIRIALIALVLTLAACASKPDRVVLLPQEGHATSLVVTGPSGSRVTLSEPYAEAVVTDRQTTAGKTDAETVTKRYASTLAATPMTPKRFILYFITGGDELTAESAAELPKIVTEVAGIPAGEVIVIGHTDRVGSSESNDALSLRRAQAVRERFIAAGLPANRISVAGRGERELAVDTPDQVAEPRNRRVEIKLR